MGTMIAISKGNRGKVISFGKTVDLLTMMVTSSRALAERVQKEKGVSMEKAEEIIIESIRDGMKVLK